MEPFLQYMAGGPCYECGGKTKYANGGQSPDPSAQAQQGAQPGADEQAKQLMGFLTEQISKGTSPSVLKRTLTQSGIKSEEAEELIGIATQMFEQHFQQGLEPKVQQQPQQPQMMQQQPHMGEDPFGAGEEQQMMRYGGLRKFIEGGFDPGPKIYNAEGTAYTQKAVDPEYEKQLTDASNLTVTNKNQISNIKDTKFNRGLAYMSGLSNPNSAIANIPDAGGFGAGLKFLAGAAGFLGSAGLGIKKFTADDRTRMYDKNGNILTDSQNPDKYKKIIDKTYNMTPEEIAQRKAEQSLATTKAEGVKAEDEAEKVKANAMNQFNTAANFRPNPSNTVYPKQTVIQNNSGPMNYMEADASNTNNSNIVKSEDERNPMDYMKESLSVPLKEEGGEWNPFVDNRRKLKFSMPLYAGGGPIDNETAPYTQQEWAIKQSKSFPLLPDDVKLYDEYSASFKNNTNATQDLTNMQKLAMQQPVTYGDPLGKVVANNALNGMQMMANSTDYFANQKKEDELKRKRIMAGNTMEAAPVVNPTNAYGSMYTLNAGPGANQNVAQLGYTFDFGTTMASAKYGGMTQYKNGGVYQVSPEELQRIIDMGGEVEFLD